MDAEVRDHYETLAQATGRTRNDLMVAALREVAEHRLHEIAMIQEGLAQARAGRTIAIADVLSEFTRDGILPMDFVLDDGTDGLRATS